MITIICGVLFVVLMVLVIFNKEDESFCAVLFLISVTGGVSSCVVDATYFNEKLAYCKQINKKNIISLSCESEEHGAFFIGTGSIDEKKYYYFYKEYNGKYILQSMPSESTYIIESNTTPHIENRLYTERITLLNIIPTERYTNIIIVPHNTIIREYRAH